MDDARFRTKLRRYWDEIARGEPATPDDLDPDLAALIRRLHALPDVPPPDPIFARRLRESLMHATTTPLPLTDPRTSLGRNGQSTPPVRRPILSALPVSPVHWAPARLVTALLVILVLIGSVLAVGRGWPEPQDDTPLLLPAMSGTPAAEIVVTETLFDAAVDGLPTAWGEVVLIRWTLRPSNQPLIFPPTNGAQVFLVESGEVTVTESGGEHPLAAGEVYVVTDPEQEVTFRHGGPEEATLLRGMVVTSWMTASADRLATSTEFLVEYSSSTLPGGSGRLVAERLTLPPGSALPPQEAGPFVWMEVGEGTLGLTLEGEDLPPGWTTGEEQAARFSLGLPPIPAGTRMTLRNAGDDPLVLYRMTLAPDAAEAAAGTAIP
jgi:hypothetical protein